MSELEIIGELPKGISALRVKEICTKIWENEKKETELHLTVLLIDSENMRKYNRQYRGLDENTDVLSFLGESLSLDGNQIQMADIIIDTIELLKQKGSKTYTEEFWQVLIHGVLHLAGYDHIKTADRKKMEDAEENYLKLFFGGEIA